MINELKRIMHKVWVVKKNNHMGLKVECKYTKAFTLK